jgi:hypothetical protein
MDSDHKQANNEYNVVLPQNTSTPVARSSRLLSRATAALARRPKTVRFRYTVKQLCVVNDPTSFL